MKKVIYTAAHSGFNLNEVPLGGAAAICHHLVQEWSRNHPLKWQILGPSVLGPGAPQNKDLVRYTELEYARFCHRFEDRLTELVLQQDPTSTVILSNDVSEGPNFSLLASKGYSVFTIYHVDVVDYFAAIYLRGIFKPESTTAFFRGIQRFGFSPLMPKMLDLVWKKQEASVRHSKGLIVPSTRMKEVLLREYPDTDPGKIHVIPWGAWGDPANPEEVSKEMKIIEEIYPSLPGTWKILTLSRISPEKGQDRLLKALALLEQDKRFPAEGIQVFISGEASYMMGMRYEKELKRLALKLKRCQVHFVGFAAPARKQAFFKTSDLYVFPSRHESYGLTLLEALRGGLPALVTSSHGALQVFHPEFGELIPEEVERDVPGLLMDSLRRLLSDRSRLKAMGHAASAWASGQKFSDAASRLTELLTSQ
jgi:glycosyltransferase involved in cell wall biosynthesis